MYAAISIHAPRAGGDHAAPFAGLYVGEFQSTPPVRGATISKEDKKVETTISIHAPRAGGDALTEAQSNEL